MSAPQSLLQAAVNRLAARLGSGLADTAATLSLLAQDAPARLQQEFSLFWEEVEQEAARIERNEPASPAGTPEAEAGGARGVWSGFAARSSAGSADPQDLIDALRAQVARLAVRLEGPGPIPSSANPASAVSATQASGSQPPGPA